MGQPANPGSPRKMAVKMVCVCSLLFYLTGLFPVTTVGQLVFIGTFNTNRPYLPKNSAVRYYYK